MESVPDWTGEQVNDAMGRAGLTQKQLAELAGVSLGTVQNFISGKTKVQAAKRAKVVRVLTYQPSATATRVLAIIEMPFSDAEKLALIRALCLAD